MKTKTLIFKLMYQAFLDIRVASYKKTGSEGIFKIADLFHNIPLKVDNISNEVEYEIILFDLKKGAKFRGCESWLNNAIEHHTKKK